jgi:hypothetical protein
MRDAEAPVCDRGCLRLRANYRVFSNHRHGARDRAFLLLHQRRDTPVTAFLTATVGNSESGIVCTPKRRCADHYDREGIANRVNGMVFDETAGCGWHRPSINCPPDRMLGSGAPRRVPQTSMADVFGRSLHITSYVERATYGCQRFAISAGSSGAAVESLWFSAIRALICLVNNRWFMLQEACGLPSTAFQVIDFDAEGRLWVGTVDRGIYRSKQPISFELLNPPRPRRLSSRPGREWASSAWSRRAIVRSPCGPRRSRSTR